VVIPNLVVVAAAIALYAFVRPDFGVLALIVTICLLIVNWVSFAFRQQRQLTTGESSENKPRIRLLWIVLLLCWLLVALQFIRR
jgi:hypothetical protein